MGNCCCIKTPIVVDVDNSCPPPEQKIEEKEIALSSLDIKPLSLDGQICVGYVVDVYDGDTCTVNMKTSAGYHQWKIRMLGYDCPEIRLSAKAEPDERQREVHKLHGKVCGNLLRKLIMGKWVLVKCSAFEKYGRVLGDIYIANKDSLYPVLNEAQSAEPNLSKYLHVNKWMLENTSAQPYDGGAHKIFDFGKFYSIEYKEELRRLLNA